MNPAVCTLFEKDYHHGVAVLVNSLVRSGYSGRVYAGFRGSLPPWAAMAAPAGPHSRTRTLPVDAGCELVFVPLDTSAHFTNIKPDFMLQVLEREAPALDHLLYLDPDIALTTHWQFVADWLSCGVALCADVNSPLGDNHPRRVGWRRHFEPAGLVLRFRTETYVNGGCVGVGRDQLHFLRNWQRLSQLMAEVIGGLEAAKVEGGGSIGNAGFASCFDCSDQDALNAAIEATPEMPVSILPRTAMAFEPGAALMPHALGPRKPWRRRYLREALAALPPTTADKAYWNCADGPLRSMPAARIRYRRLSLAVANGMGRIYRRR